MVRCTTIFTATNTIGIGTKPMFQQKITKISKDGDQHVLCRGKCIILSNNDEVVAMAYAFCAEHSVPEPQRNNIISFVGFEGFSAYVIGVDIQRNVWNAWGIRADQTACMSRDS